MYRTNIYITDDQRKRLAIRAREQGLTMSEIVRRILDEGLGLATREDPVEDTIRSTAGIWADRDETETDAVLAWRREVPLERLER